MLACWQKFAATLILDDGTIAAGDALDLQKKTILMYTMWHEFRNEKVLGPCFVVFSHICVSWYVTVYCQMSYNILRYVCVFLLNALTSFSTYENLSPIRLLKQIRQKVFYVLS